MQKEWEIIKKDLLRSGGDFLLRPKSEPHLDKLLKGGRERKSKEIRTLDGDDGLCHQISIREWQRGRGDLITGYALSEDGGWRQHSWLEANGVILEPTRRARKCYWGVRLSDNDAASWSKQIPAKKLRWWQPVGVLLILILIAGTIFWASQGAPLPFPEPEPLRI